MKSSTNKLLQVSTSFRVLWFGLVWVTAVLNLSLLPATAEPNQIELQRGIQSFNSKHYSDAVGHLQQYVVAAPHESIGHYYLANCLFNLGYEKPSLDQYAIALKESTSQIMTDYCRDAIRSMQASKQATALAPARHVPNTSLTTPELLVPNTSLTTPALLVPNTLPTISPVELPAMLPREGVPDLALEKTLVRMSDQSNLEIETLQRNYVAGLASIKQHLADDLLKINRDRDARIQALSDGVRIKGSSSSNTYPYETIDSIKKDTDSKIETATSAAAATTQAHEQEFLSQLAKIQNALKVSQNQIADARRMPGSQPNLQLAGSDLYTRNFVPSPNPPPPDELMATSERLILDAHSRPGRTISRVVRDPVEPVPLPPGTDLKVHGQLIK